VRLGGRAAGSATAGAGAAAAAAASAGSPPAVTAAAGSSKPTCRWSWWSPSVKYAGSSIAHGEPISVGRMSADSVPSASASSRAAALPGLTGAPSTVAMSAARPKE